ncbi:hypothetical protein ACFLWF_00485 [Chloroflexota bacterium]
MPINRDNTGLHLSIFTLKGVVMKKFIILSIVVVIIGLVGGAAIVVGSPFGSSPNVEVVNPVVEFSENATVTIAGSGFEPGQEVRILFTTSGVKSATADIGYALEPQPIASKSGAWITVWSAGRYVSKGLVSEGAYSIVVTDTDYNELAIAPFAFAAASE